MEENPLLQATQSEAVLQLKNADFWDFVPISFAKTQHLGFLGNQVMVKDCEVFSKCV